VTPGWVLVLLFPALALSYWLVVDGYVRLEAVSDRAAIRRAAEQPFPCDTQGQPKGRVHYDRGSGHKVWSRP
jgi:hypothetical protein